jgi:hypothetical protein
MQASTYISSFYIAKLAQAVSSPFTSMEAYRSGVIDASGNITKPESSIDPFEYLVIKLKKIFEQLPYGTTKAQLSNYMSTLNLFTEQASPELEMFLEGVVSSLDINEDTAIAGGGGAPGSLGTPSASVVTGGIVGFDPVMAVGLKKKQPPKYFKDCEIFDVCPEEMASFKAAKQWKDVPDSETKTYLQRFQRRNKNAKIGVRGLNPVSGDQDLYWITYPSKNFLGEGNNDPIEVMATNVAKPPQEDFDKDGKPIKGARQERIGRLVLGAEGERVASETGSQELLRTFLDRLDDVANKPVTNNKVDAYTLDPETLEIEGRDVKSHDTSLGGRINKKDYSEHPELEDIMGKIGETMRITDMDPEEMKKIKTETRKRLERLGQGRQDVLKDVALQNVGDSNLLVIGNQDSTKRSRFPFASTLLPLEKLKGLIGSSRFRYGLETRPGRAEVKIRTTPDFSSQRAQTVMAQDLQTGEMTSAQMHPETLQNILSRTSPGLRDVLRRSLEPYVLK